MVLVFGGVPQHPRPGNLASLSGWRGRDAVAIVGSPATDAPIRSMVMSYVVIRGLWGELLLIGGAARFVIAHSSTDRKACGVNAVAIMTSLISW